MGNSEFGMRIQFASFLFRIPHSQLRFHRIIPSVGVNGRGRFTMGLRRLESVPHQPGFLIDLCLRRQAIKNGVEQGHGTQSNHLGTQDLWPSASKASPIPSVQVCPQWIKGNPPLPKSRPFR